MLNRPDIQKILRQLGSIDFMESNGWMMTNCPLAPWEHEGGTDSHPSMGITIEPGKSTANCFSCGFSGTVVKMIRVYAGHAIKEGDMSEQEMEELIDAALLAEYEEVEDKEYTEQKIEVPEEWVKGLGSYHEYFAEQGISEQTAERFNLGYVHQERRVLYPLYDENELVGIIGRSIMQKYDRKYKNQPKSLKTRKYLYGLNAKFPDAKKLIIVEGPKDTVIGNQVLIANGMNEEYHFVGLLGSSKAVSEEKVDLMAEHAEEIIIMTDNDSSGRLALERLKEEAGNRVVVSEVNWESGMEDPAENRDKIVELIETRTYSFEKDLKKALGRSW